MFMISVVAVPELRALLPLANGPATAEQVAARLDIELSDARARLGHCIHFHTVKPRHRRSGTVYAPTSTGRLICTALQAMEADLFGRAVSDAEWQACVDALPVSARPPLPDGFLQYGQLSPEDHNPIHELAALQHLEDGAQTAAGVAAAMRIDLSEAEQSLEWCRDAGLLKVVVSPGGVYYALTKRGRELSYGDGSPSAAEARELRQGQAGIAALRQERAARAVAQAEALPDARWSRQLVAVLLGVAAMLWWIFADTAWPGFVIFVAGYLMYWAEKQRTKAPDASPDQHGP